MTVYEKITRAVPVGGDLVPDAHLMGLLRHHGVIILYTTDTDFRKFAWPSGSFIDFCNKMPRMTYNSELNRWGEIRYVHHDRSYWSTTMNVRK